MLLRSFHSFSSNLTVGYLFEKGIYHTRFILEA